MSNSESTRVRRLYERLAGSIPCDPEDVRTDLHAMAHWELLSRYFSWADRMITPRPRRVVTWDGIHQHGKADSHWDEVCALAAEIEAGNDLTPYLSKRVRIGYVRDKTKWEDKDYALNAYDMHHLHLSRMGTEELLYVNFSKEHAFFLMVGDHNSFDDGSLADAVAQSRIGTAYEVRGIQLKSSRTMKEYNQVQRRGIATFFPVGDQVVVGATLSAAGTSWDHVRHAQRILKKITALDPLIDKPGFGRDWFKHGGKEYPASPTFEWAMDHCDLCLIEITAYAKFPLESWRR